MNSVIIYVRSLILFLLQIVRKIIFTLIRWVYKAISYMFILFMVWWIISETAYSPIYSFEKFTTEKWQDRGKKCYLYECLEGCRIYDDLVENYLKIGMRLEDVFVSLGEKDKLCQYANGVQVYSYPIGDCVWKPHFGGPRYDKNILYLFFSSDNMLISIRDDINAFFFPYRHYKKISYGVCKDVNGEVVRYIK